MVYSVARLRGRNRRLVRVLACVTLLLVQSGASHRTFATEPRADARGGGRAHGEQARRLRAGERAPLPKQRVARAAVVVDASARHQVMEGFGATTLALVYGGFDVEGYDDEDNLSPTLRAAALRAVYGEVGLTMGHLNLPMLEKAFNDDADPFHYNWTGFDTREAAFMKRIVVDPAAGYGFDNYSLAHNIDFRQMGFLKGIRDADYERYLDECAEHVLAGAIYWRDTFGTVPATMTLFNEPLSGNGELQGGSTQELVDIVKRAGGRLRREGFPDLRFVVAGEETEERSLESATAILADPEARTYVAAIAYHPYPYGSTYSSIANILRTSGSGKPDLSRIAVRRQLRDLGRQYGIPVWMTEVSNGGAPFDSMDALRGRAIHIHDELEYADSAAYFGMVAIWDSKTHFEHTHGSRPLLGEGDSVVIVDSDSGRVIITGMGYAIGHFARWVKRGAVRISAGSDDPLVLASAFLDDSRGRVVMVLVNNAAVDRRVTVSLKGARIVGDATGEQSADDSRWKHLEGVKRTASGVRLKLPPESVTTISCPT